MFRVEHPIHPGGMDGEESEKVRWPLREGSSETAACVDRRRPFRGRIRGRERRGDARWSAAHASPHAARCDICMSEAVMAYRMSQNGASLDAIRAEVDKTYGS
jgi:hypothetical protein